jgi:phage terminase small subunit
MKTQDRYKTPKALSREALAWWNQIISEHSIDDSAGRLLLQVALESFDEMRSAERRMAADGGPVYLDSNKQPRAHPAVRIARDARTAMMRALRHLELDVEPPNHTIGRPPGR